MKNIHTDAKSSLYIREKDKVPDHSIITTTN